ncbi:hypothetical protein [Ferruginibacter sp.]
MELRLPSPVSKFEIETAILQWIELLAVEDYTGAFDLTLHDPYYQWTPELLKKVIEGYGLPDEIENVYKVTKAEDSVIANGQHIYKDVEFVDRPSGLRKGDLFLVGEAFFDLPLNGNWSDLTATFKIFSNENYSALELNEIRVL